MFRLTKSTRSAAYVGGFLLVLLLLYLLNNDEGQQFNPELRENVLSEYDDYMGEYDDESYVELNSLVVADIGKGLDEDYIDTTDETLLAKAAKDKQKAMNELVIVVVEKTDEDGTKMEDEKKKSKPLDSPSEVPEYSEKDVLRENDEIVNGLIIDKSDDLFKVRTLTQFCNLSRYCGLNSRDDYDFVP